MNPLKTIAVVTLIVQGMAVGGEIHSAAERGNADRVKALLQAKPDLAKTKDEHGRTPLECALLSVNPEVVELLAPGDSSMDIFVAAALGKTNRVAGLLKQDPDLAKKHDSFQKTALHWAAMYGQDGTAARLLSQHAEADAKDAEGFRPLHWAAMFDRPGVAKLLLAEHAEINAKDPRYHWTPLRLAVIHDRGMVAEVLLAGGADPNVADIDGIPILHQAVIYGRAEMVALLLKYKTDVNIRDTTGNTALWLAVQKRHKRSADYNRIADLLRQHGGVEK